MSNAPATQEDGQEIQLGGERESAQGTGKCHPQLVAFGLWIEPTVGGGIHASRCLNQLKQVIIGYCYLQGPLLGLVGRK